LAVKPGERRDRAGPPFIAAEVVLHGGIRL